MLEKVTRITWYKSVLLLLVCRGEFKEKHKKWFKEAEPELSPDVDVRIKFTMSPHLDGLHRMALRVKEEMRAVMNELLLVI